jgi:hypothetical protein
MAANVLAQEPWQWCSSRQRFCGHVRGEILRFVAREFFLGSSLTPRFLAVLFRRIRRLMLVARS